MSSVPPGLSADIQLRSTHAVSGPIKLNPDTNRPILLCLSHLRWDFVFQRPQHLLTRAAQKYRTFFVEEPVFADVDVPHLHLTSRPGGIQVAVPHLPHGKTPVEIMRLQRDLVDGLIAEQGQPEVLWYYSPMALSFTSHLSAPVCLYDCMDELSAFRGAPPDLTLWERRLFAKADFVLAGGRSIYQSKRRQHPSVHMLASSIDTAHFAVARNQPDDPVDQRHIPHPRLGFFGVIDERFDAEMVRDAAKLRPDWHFVMIGPVVKIDPADLPQAANIHWLGGKSYAELPAYLGNWDVGIMPFAINESTRFISPTKTPEFLAAGLPVVSTAIADVVVPYGEAGLVDIAETAQRLCSKVEPWLEGKRPGWQESVDQALAENSWDLSWQRVDDVIAYTMLTRARPAAGAAQQDNVRTGANHRTTAPAAMTASVSRTFAAGSANATIPASAMGAGLSSAFQVSASGKEGGNV